jgi:hypothetical protein
MASRSAEDVSALPDHPSERGTPERAAGHDLRGRLAELPSNHPSAADYGSQRERGLETSARGEVERVGLGIVDERASRFQPREHRLADHLAGEGHSVVAVHDGYGREGRKPDAAVDGIPTEFKCLDPGASDRTVKAALTSAKGQAREVVIDGRDSGLTSEDADRGVRRFLGAPYADRVDAIRIIGADHELEWKRG